MEPEPPYIAHTAHGGYLALTREERERHVYVVGKSGSGKSTTLFNLAMHDIYAGEGVAVIDPHGTLAEAILDCIPRARTHEVCYLDAADTEQPVGFNPLADVPAPRRALAAAGIVSAFRHLWHDSWGPRLEHFLYNGVAALLETPRSTLLDLPRLYTDDDFRDGVVARITDPAAGRFWRLEYPGYDARYRMEAAAPILNKAGQFAASPNARLILGQTAPKFDLGYAMDHRRILIVNLAKGQIGEQAANLLGSLLVSHVQLIAMRRSDLAPENRVPFFVHVDEFQSFGTEAFAGLLSEARKFATHFCLANQYTDQLAPAVRAAVLGNAGAMLVFRVSGADAELLGPEFNPLPSGELVDQLPFRAWIRRGIGHQYVELLPRLFPPASRFSAVRAQSSTEFWPIAHGAAVRRYSSAKICEILTGLLKSRRIEMLRLLLCALIVGLASAGIASAQQTPDTSDGLSFRSPVEVLRPMAEQGDANAQNLLGVKFANGFGVAKNDAEAVKWFRKAAVQGYSAGETWLGNMYVGGRGVPKDDAEAVKWYSKAAAHGSAIAAKALAELAASGVSTGSTAAPSSNKPSFDCETAKSGAARLICSDGELSKTDAELGKAFEASLSGVTGSDKDALIKKQVAWLRARNRHCNVDGKTKVSLEDLTAVKPCMLFMLRKRIADLSGATRETPISANAEAAPAILAASPPMQNKAAEQSSPTAAEAPAQPTVPGPLIAVPGDPPDAPDVLALLARGFPASKFCRREPIQIAHLSGEDWARVTFWDRSVCVNNGEGDPYAAFLRRTQTGAWVITCKDHRGDLPEYDYYSKLCTGMPREAYQALFGLPHPVATVTSAPAGANCSISNDWPDMGDVKWVGGCKDGFASGTGKAIWYKNGIVSFEQQYSESSGLVQEHGRATALTAGIRKAIEMNIPSCPPSYMVQRVNIDAPPSLDLDDSKVVNYLLLASQRLAWQKCPSSGFDVAVEVRVQGKRAVWARAYNSVGPSAPEKADWQEYINTFRDEKLNRYNSAYAVEFNRREEGRREEERKRMQQEAAARERQLQEAHQQAIARLADHGVTVSGPLSAETLECVQGFFPKTGFSAPMFKATPCSEYMGVYDVKTLDSRDIPGGVEVMTEVTLQLTQPLAAQSLLAGACYGGTQNDMHTGDTVLVKTRIQFEKWNSGLRCMSEHF